MRAHNFVDLTGNRFDRLLVLCFDHKDSTRTVWWRCLCDCGNVKVVRGYCLTGGVTRSCDCLKREAASKRLTKHGQGGTRNRKTGEWIRKPSKEFEAWVDAKQRVDNPNNKRYDGIKKMCAGFRSGFSVFFAVVGACPDPALSLHRIDNTAHYSCGQCDECKANGWPLNCKWATEIEQQNGKSNNRTFALGGKEMTVAEWGRFSALNPAFIYTRLYQGWEPYKIFSNYLQLTNDSFRLWFAQVEVC